MNQSFGKLASAVILSLGVALASTSPAMAHDLSQVEAQSVGGAVLPQSFGTANSQYEDFDEVTDSNKLNEILPGAKKAAIQDTKIESTESIDFESVTVKETPQGTYVVNFPIDTEHETDIASTTVFLDELGKAETTYQISLYQIDSTSGRVQTYAGGEKTLDKVVTEPESNPNQIQPQTILDWGKVNQCLNNAGVASWAVAGLSVICSAACIATAGLGCIGCIAAAATVTGATAGSCVGAGLSNG